MQSESTAVEVMGIVSASYHLPVTVDKLNQFIIVGKERLNAQKAKIRAIDKTEMAVEAKEAALADAQDMADILLDAEVKLGEILEAIPSNIESSGYGRIEKKPSLPPDISHKASQKLRNYLMDTVTGRGQSFNGSARSDISSNREVYVKCIHAWNAYRRGKNTDLKYHAQSPIPKAV